MPREKLLTMCAWAVHLYTALGAVAGLLALEYVARDDFRAAFTMMAVAVVIDSSDGPLARRLRVRERIPVLDGALLDNVVDYLNYVAAPVFLMLRARLIPPGMGGLLLAGFVMVASAYGFCRVDAKTEDNYFRGFPSYWNLVALYLFCLGLPPGVNEALLVALAVMVFVPIKYIYPNRTELMRPLTLALAAIWAVATVAMLPMLPAHNPILLYTSLGFVVYYFVMSLLLHAHPARIANRRAMARDA
jgi:phosphatidylcholine synthase